MANTFNISGSPLGLIGLRSRPNQDGMSSFNAGDSRNVNVNDYNSGRDQDTNIKKKDGSVLRSPVSLFSGGSIPNFWPNVGQTGNNDKTGLDRDYNGINRNDLHNNDIYDTSLLNIIEKLSFSKMASVRPQDFAYLKNVGVYPNNRLMIARRFLSPVKDNLLGMGGTPPSSILISWNPEDKDFLSMDFGEEWTEAEADFTNILNGLGGEFRTGGVGTGLGKGANILPLPGFTETLQREVLEYMGVLSKGEGDSPLPSGNPNIIKMAKRRKTFGYGQSGSGLKCNVSIKMVVEYEQKFISGIDPTIAWMDILNNVFSFGTSMSSNYGLSKKFGEKLNQWSKDPSILIDDIINGIKMGLEVFVKAVKDSVDDIKSAINRRGMAPKEKSEQDIKAVDLLVNGLTKLSNSALESIKKSIQKYRVELMGVANSLSGAPSTPWHITLGNPLRPTFCSGDMYMPSDMTLTLGPTLSFNDLPTNIKVEFTLQNARPWGLQEILAKFNTGNLRTVNISKDYLEVLDGPPGGIYFNNPDKSSDLGKSDGASYNSLTNDKITKITTTKENEN